MKSIKNALGAAALCLMTTTADAQESQNNGSTYLSFSSASTFGFHGSGMSEEQAQTAALGNCNQVIDQIKRMRRFVWPCSLNNLISSVDQNLPRCAVRMIFNQNSTTIPVLHRSGKTAEQALEETGRYIVRQIQQTGNARNVYTQSGIYDYKLFCMEDGGGYTVRKTSHHEAIEAFRRWEALPVELRR